VIEIPDLPNAYEMSLETAVSLLQLISDSYEENEDYFWDIKAMVGILERCCSPLEEPYKLYGIILKERNMSRRQSDGTFSDAPDGGYASSVAKSIAIDRPCIILTRQNGNESEGWKGHAFWWPVIVTPKNTQIAIFASRVGHSK
jgi:hypothetical protein